MSHGFLDLDHKRRLNPTTSNTVNGYSNSTPVTSKYGNVSSSFNSSNAVPNDSHIMQNSSLASSATKNSARSFSSQRQRSSSEFRAQSQCKLPFCKIVIESHPYPSSPPSKILKCIGDYIRNEASRMDGFHAKSFNIQFNEKFKNHQCFVYFATLEQAKQAGGLFNNKRIYDCQLKYIYHFHDNAVPNDSNIMQNSSLASSATKNGATSFNSQRQRSSSSSAFSVQRSAFNGNKKIF